MKVSQMALLLVSSELESLTVFDFVLFVNTVRSVHLKRFKYSEIGILLPVLVKTSGEQPNRRWQ